MSFVQIDSFIKKRGQYGVLIFLREPVLVAIMYKQVLYKRFRLYFATAVVEPFPKWPCSGQVPVTFPCNLSRQRYRTESVYCLVDLRVLEYRLQMFVLSGCHLFLFDYSSLIPE